MDLFLQSLTTVHFLIGLMGVGLGLLFGVIVASGINLRSRRKISKRAIAQSKRTTMGYVSESLAPLLPEFPFHYKDLVYLGKGTDYIVFDGMHAGTIKQIVFLEIKQGSSRINANERRIKDAIQAGKCAYKVWRM